MDCSLVLSFFFFFFFFFFYLISSLIAALGGGDFPPLHRIKDFMVFRCNLTVLRCNCCSPEYNTNKCVLSM